MSESASSSSSSSLSLSVLYEPEISEGGEPGVPFVEHSPELHLWLSAHANPRHYVVQRITDTRRFVPVQLELHATGLLPRATALGLAGYCKTWNEDGKPCKTTAGCAHIELAELVERAAAAATENSTESLRIELPLCERADRNLRKGRVVLLFRTAGGGLRLASGTRLSLEPGDGTAFCEATRADCEARMRAAIQRSLACFYSEYAPAFPRLAKIHCPEFRTTASVVPGSAYVLQAPPVRTGEAYFLNAKNIVFARLGMRDTDFNAAVEAALAERGDLSTAQLADLNMALSALCDVMTLFTSSKYYLGDRVNEARPGEPVPRTKPVEHYKCARLSEDDCEGDGADENMLLCQEFQRLSSVRSRTLRNMQRLLDYYVPLVPLAGVTLPSVSGGAAALPNAYDRDSLLAHIFCQIVPRVRVARMLEASNPPELARRAIACMEWERVPRRAWEDSLEIFVLEGTGWLCAGQKPPAEYAVQPESALGRAIDSAHARQRFVETRFPALRDHCTTRIFSSAQTDATDHRDISPFYKVMVAAYTSYFVDRGCNFSDVAFVSEAHKTYGIDFGSLLYEAGTRASTQRFGMHICTEWSSTEMRTVRSVLALEEPYPPLLAPPPTNTDNLGAGAPIIGGESRSSQSLGALQASIDEWAERRLFAAGNSSSSAIRRAPAAATTTMSGSGISSNALSPRLSLISPSFVLCQVRAEEFRDESLPDIIERVCADTPELSEQKLRVRYFDYALRSIACVPTRDMDEPPLAVVDLLFYVQQQQQQQ
jgi:hypothetical protein